MERGSGDGSTEPVRIPQTPGENPWPPLPPTPPIFLAVTRDGTGEKEEEEEEEKPPPLQDDISDGEEEPRAPAARRRKRMGPERAPLPLPPEIIPGAIPPARFSGGPPGKGEPLVGPDDSGTS